MSHVWRLAVVAIGVLTVGQACLALTDVGPIEQMADEIGTFKVLTAGKVKLHCNSGSGGQKHAQGYQIETNGCFAVLERHEQPINHAKPRIVKVYTGSKGCSYKHGQVVKVDLVGIECDDLPKVTCSIKPIIKVDNVDTSPTNKEMVCRSDSDAYIRGAVKDRQEKK